MELRFFVEEIIVVKIFFDRELSEIRGVIDGLENELFEMGSIFV